LRIKTFCAIILAFLFIGACDRRDRERAREEAGQAREKARELGKKAENEAKDVKRRVNDSLANRTGGSSAEGAAEKLDHAALLAKIKAKLASDVGLATITGVDVDATSHVVTLRGNVSSIDQKRRAGEVVSQIPGVTKVTNDLQVSQ
jgi:osmotically-inducible protein OsmY